MNHHQDGYTVSEGLVTAVLKGIVVSIISIGAYMVIWGINDARFKSSVQTDLEWIKERVGEIGKDQDEHEARKHDAFD